MSARVVSDNKAQVRFSTRNTGNIIGSLGVRSVKHYLSVVWITGHIL